MGDTTTHPTLSMYVTNTRHTRNTSGPPVKPRTFSSAVEIFFTLYDLIHDVCKHTPLKKKYCCVNLEAERILFNTSLERETSNVCNRHYLTVTRRYGVSVSVRYTYRRFAFDQDQVLLSFRYVMC